MISSAVRCTSGETTERASEVGEVRALASRVTLADNAPSMITRSQRILSWCGIVVGTLYVLNPGWGFLEFIPDFVPVFGNLDEAGATLLVVQSIRKLRSTRN